LSDAKAATTIPGRQRGRTLPDPTSAQLKGFLPEATSVFESLLNLELQPVPALDRQVDRHLADLQEAHGRNEFLDLAMAWELAGASHRLLALSPTATEADQRLIQAAVLHFVLANDASPDTGWLLGLEDDAKVLQAVARHFDAR